LFYFFNEQISSIVKWVLYEHNNPLCSRIAVLTGAVGCASKRSLIVQFTVSGPVPCSGAKRRDKVLDEVSAAIPGDAVAGNVPHHQRPSFWASA